MGRRGRPRFTLNFLFIAVTICALACAAGMWLLEWPRSPQAELRGAGIGLSHRRVKQSLLIHPESKLSLKALKAARKLEPPVYELVVTDRAWSDDLARWIDGLPTITSLRFQNCEGFDASFAETLQQHSGLTRLDLRGSDVSHVTLPTDSSLQTLVLDNSNVTNQQMKPVATYSHLAQFSANKTALTDAGLVTLLDLPLRNVSLIETPASVELVEQLLETDSIVIIELSEGEFAYDAFAKYPQSRSKFGGSRVNIHHKDWLKGR